MLKNKFLPILVISFFLISTKSLAVAHPEYINWRGSPRDFVISLYEGVLEVVTQNQAMINNLASSINSDPQSRLDLFWRFINSTDYQNSMWAGQLKEYQVYYEYVLSGNVEKYSYYIAKQPAGADMLKQGAYSFGVAMALRDFWATFVPRSIEYGQMWNFVPNYLRSSPNPIPINIDPIPYDPNPYDPNLYDPNLYDPNSFSNYLDDQIKKIEEYYQYDPNPYESITYDPNPYDPNPYDSNSYNTIDPNNQHHSNCNDKQEAGANKAESHTIDLGQYSGSFMFDYDTKQIKDQIIITHDGNIIFDSRCVGERKSVRLTFSGYSTSITVRVNPNCDGSSSTEWNFTVHCPDRY